LHLPPPPSPGGLYEGRSADTSSASLHEINFATAFRIEPWDRHGSDHLRMAIPGDLKHSDSRTRLLMQPSDNMPASA
jgi:hypothetical protein